MASDEYLMNRMHNSSNRNQTDAKRVLCLCSAGLLRSPTMANVLHKDFLYNTRAAGVSKEYALIPVDRVLLAWADEIVCVHQSVANTLLAEFPDVREDRITVLNIPDQYQWGDDELKEHIYNQYKEALDSKERQYSDA